MSRIAGMRAGEERAGGSTAAAWLFSAAIALSVFSGSWREIGLANLVSPDRLALGLGLIVFVAQDPARGRRPRVRLAPVHVVLLLAAAFAICSAVAAGTIAEKSIIAPLVDRFGLVPFLLFAVAPAVFWGERQRRILLGTLLGVGAYLGLTALFQGLGLDALVFPRYIVHLSTEAQAGRARGPFTDSAANGVALFDCAAMAALAAITFSGAWTRRLSIAIAALCLLGLLFTQERSVWLGAVAATLCAAIMAPAVRRRLPFGLAAAALCLAAAFIFIPGLGEQTSERIGDQRTAWDRLNLNRAAENMIAARPLFGFGLGSFQARSEPYFEQNPNFPLSNTSGELHNVFLSNAAELGLVGASIWLLGLLLAVGGAIFLRGPPELYPWRVALLAVAVMWLVVANLVPMREAFPNQFLWLLAGVVWPWRYVLVPGRASPTVEARLARA